MAVGAVADEEGHVLDPGGVEIVLRLTRELGFTFDAPRVLG